MEEEEDSRGEGAHHARLQIIQPLPLQELHGAPLGDPLLGHVQIHGALPRQRLTFPGQVLRLPAGGQK